MKLLYIKLKMKQNTKNQFSEPKMGIDNQGLTIAIRAGVDTTNKVYICPHIL